MLTRSKVRVLLIEDSPQIRSSLREKLEFCGFKLIWECKNGQDAWKILYSSYYSGAPFDLVICDHDLKGMSGLELLKLMRAFRPIANTPFVMMSGECTKENVLNAVNAGVSEFMLKTIGKTGLHRKIARARAGQFA